MIIIIFLIIGVLITIIIFTSLYFKRRYKQKYRTKLKILKDIPTQNSPLPMTSNTINASFESEVTVNPQETSTISQENDNTVDISSSYNYDYIYFQNRPRSFKTVMLKSKRKLSNLKQEITPQSSSSVSYIDIQEPYQYDYVDAPPIPDRNQSPLPLPPNNIPVNLPNIHSIISYIDANNIQTQENSNLVPEDFITPQDIQQTNEEILNNTSSNLSENASYSQRDNENSDILIQESINEAAGSSILNSVVEVGKDAQKSKHLNIFRPNDFDSSYSNNELKDNTNMAIHNNKEKMSNIGIRVLPPIPKFSNLKKISK
jgi:hypothetical protein